MSRNDCQAEITYIHKYNIRIFCSPNIFIQFYLTYLFGYTVAQFILYFTLFMISVIIDMVNVHFSFI